MLESIDFAHFYVGITSDLRARLVKHNAGEVPHTSKYRPWRLKTYVAFSDEARAIAFEKYLKSGSGRAFAKRRL
ncbi:MAG: GIY-YIG nuclease family protein [Methyloceanibacter sp.]